MSGAAAEAGAGNASIALKGLRGAIARNMAAGWQAPRVAMGIDVDVSACRQWLRTQAVAEGQARPTITACVLRATALALAGHPRMNALLKDNVVECQSAVHLGLAVALDEGLMVPVIRDAETKPVAQLAQETRALAAGTRAGQLPPRAYQGATFTVTNLGMTGIDWFTPVLNPPQVGILGVSSVRERAVVRDGQLAIAAMTTLTLVFDHRAIDGYPAALFLQAVKARLEAPGSL
ncbi:MAG TPA: 2-oxo acid dehydrogenase subunit E2 [Alicycliphilus denitrificans]|nr:2-oxo acid dehydrogenase subunit E2 [Alicycliphilus denitrificans]